jgi:hypothetical protein
MRSIGRLAVGYLLAGLAVAVLENWIAHARAGSSILEVATSAMPMADKTAAFYDLVLFPILAWPVRVIAMIRGG